MTETLQQIGKKWGTDKHDDRHSYAGSSYLEIYHRYLNELRNKNLKILEIGVRDGCSHRMWQEYFPYSTIYGIDIDPRCNQQESDRIKVFIGSQSDPDTIKKAVDHASGLFDIVIDDGSHVNELTLKSFDLLFPCLSAGGFYIMEDMHCTHLGDDLKYHIVMGGWPGMQYNQDVNFSNDRKTMDKFFNSIINDIDYANPNIPVEGGRMGIEWIHFYSSIAIMKKVQA